MQSNRHPRTTTVAGPASRTAASALRAAACCGLALWATAAGCGTGSVNSRPAPIPLVSGPAPSAERVEVRKPVVPPSASDAATLTVPPAGTPPAVVSVPVAAPAPAAPSGTVPPMVPAVLLSQEMLDSCLVRVGQPLPDVQLPDTSGRPQALAALRGSRLTVVFCWSGASPHSVAMLADMGPEVADRYGTAGVRVAGLHIGSLDAAAQQALDQWRPGYPVLVDADGEYFKRLTTGDVPRVFLLDAAGQVLWFDLEYSRETRRHLDEAILAALSKP